jgi:hypothetical protein
MSRFLNATITDMKSGRETWRVLAAICIPAFILTIAITVVR